MMLVTGVPVTLYCGFKGNYWSSRDTESTLALGLAEIIRADLNFTIKTCTVGIG